MFFITACSRYDAVRLARVAASGDPVAAAQSLATSKATSYAMNPKALERDLKAFKSLLEKFIKAVGGEWGTDDVELPSTKRYVKYTQNYRSRALVDFDTGMVTVETVDTKNPRKSLREAIVITLLTPSDPRAVDLYSSKPVELGETPFLLGEVLDQDDKQIRWEWRAGRFADHLVADKIRTRTSDSGKTVHYVGIPMVRDHLHVRAAKYRTYVQAAAERFKISRNLIYAIMKVESDFNPFAVSSAMAIGLMQVVQKTAGGDVYRMLHGKQGYPSRQALFTPSTNITYGSGYLYLLQYRYLAGVNDPVSREYCVIAGYNGGAGGVLRAFHKDKSIAAQRINSMNPAQVYEKLRKDLPYDETKRYLYKVLNAKKEFVNF
ncbi:membrane-bound lytic murein transglycosylase MltC [Salidesulfovibrio onnuriiensis]|uniref:membrane-bound lytic murein transglycosylase MltC n=1 Tax=Salidesulfovibrio onnuriiensis TaxID=2583823 RepID=UPI00202B9D90|nr:membrane-bound lytic murein transglycosylase MltC [Salidesulfovibrio onnuriiensis]